MPCSAYFAFWHLLVVATRCQKVIKMVPKYCYFTALLAAACPEGAPFMADECLMAIPEIEGIDYTTKEYLKFVNHIKAVVERLNKNSDGSIKWSPHKVELAIWTHYIVTDLKPELLSSKYLSANITLTLN